MGEAEASCSQAGQSVPGVAVATVPLSDGKMGVGRMWPLRCHQSPKFTVCFLHEPQLLRPSRLKARGLWLDTWKNFLSSW